MPTSTEIRALRGPRGTRTPLAVVRDVESGEFSVICCTYCGEPSDSRDHIEPSLLVDGVERSFGDPDNLVPACMSCNGLLGSRYFGSGVEGVREKAFFLAQRITQREAKYLRQPIWAEQEIKSLRGSLRAKVRTAQLRKAQAYRRIDHCFRVYDGYTGQKLTAALTFGQAQEAQL